MPEFWTVNSHKQLASLELEEKKTYNNDTAIDIMAAKAEQNSGQIPLLPDCLFQSWRLKTLFVALKQTAIWTSEYGSHWQGEHKPQKMHRAETECLLSKGAILQHRAPRQRRKLFVQYEQKTCT